MEEIDLKMCSKCLEEKSLDWFYKLKNGGVTSICRICSRKNAKDFWLKNRFSIKEKRRNLYPKNREKILKTNKEWREKTNYKRGNRSYSSIWHKKNHLKYRINVLIGLGHECSCCGEKRREFLALDHVNGNGSTHRKQKNQLAIYREVINLGFPKDKYRLLCHNCNQSIGYYGYCPHGNLVTKKLLDNSLNKM